MDLRPLHFLEVAGIPHLSRHIETIVQKPDAQNPDVCCIRSADAHLEELMLRSQIEFADRIQQDVLKSKADEVFGSKGLL